MHASKKVRRKCKFFVISDTFVQKKRKKMHKEELKLLRELIVAQDVSKLSENTENFRGADIIVSDDPECPSSNGWSDYIRVITPFCREVSWLILQLKDIFREELDFVNKYHFYGAMAEAANTAIKKDSNNRNAVLVAMIERAETIEI